MVLFLSSAAWSADVNLRATVQEHCAHYSWTTDVHDAVDSGFVSETGTPPSPGVFYVDLFFDRPVAPSMGEWGDIWYEIDPAELWAPGFVFNAGDLLPWDGYYAWVDVIVDSENFVAETDETDNLVSMYIESPCGF